MLVSRHGINAAVGGFGNRTAALRNGIAEFVAYGLGNGAIRVGGFLQVCRKY